MIFVPFIYFTLLTIYWWKTHQGLDLCVYMAGLYALTSLFGIIVVEGNMIGRTMDDGGILFDNFNLQLSIVPTLLYCAVITIGLFPFSLIYRKELKTISTPNPLITYVVSWFLIGVSVINLYLVADSTAEILSGDLASVRYDHYSGLESPAEIKAMSMPFIFRFLYYFNISTLLALPLFFYYVCFEKERAWWFKLLLFFASLSVPIAGIQTVDRTEIMFYSMMFISCIILFRNHLSTIVKRIMKIASIPMALLALVYIVAVSDARFSKTEGGAETGAVQYAGQNYLNFCYFWEYANYDELATERVFPLASHYLLHIDNGEERRAIRSGQQKFFISVFPSYAGDIMLDLSPIGLIVWALVMLIISLVVVKHSHREELSVGEYLMCFVISVIPIFGIFYYRYMAFPYTYMILIAVLLYITDKFNIVISRRETNDEEKQIEE